MKRKSKEEKIAELKQLAMDNYEKGGHWIVECFDDYDYQDILDEAGGSLSKAKSELRATWKTKESYAQDIMATAW